MADFKWPCPVCGLPCQATCSWARGSAMSHLRLGLASTKGSPDGQPCARAWPADTQEDDKDYQVTSDTQLLQSKRKVTQFIDPLKIFTTVTDPTFHDKLADGLSTALCSKQQQTALQAAQNRIQQLSVLVTAHVYQ